MMSTISQMLIRDGESGEASLGTTVMNNILELGLFMASDFIVRPYFRQTAQGQRDLSRRDVQFRMLIAQEVLLLVSTLFILFLHHTPYVLIIAAAAVLVRACHLKLYAHNDVMPSGHFQPAAVSKPFRQSSSPWSATGFYAPQKGNLDQRNVLQNSQPHPLTDSIKAMPRNDMQVKHSSNFSSNSATLSLSEPVLRNRHLQQDLGRSSLSLLKTPKPTSLLKASVYRSSHKASPLLQEEPPPRSQLAHSIEESSPVPRARNSAQASVEHQPFTAVSDLPSASNMSSETNLIPRAATMFPYSLRSSIEGRPGNVFYPPSITPPGLQNEGNTCFINSTLQCLNWTPGFMKLFSQFTASAATSDTTIFISKLNHVLLSCNQLPDGNKTFSPISTSELLSSMSLLDCHLVAPSNFPQNQQDAAEFLLWLLNHLHNTLRAQGSNQTGAGPTFSDTQIESMKKSKRDCEVRISKNGSKNQQALQEPMNQLSELDWNLYSQGHSSSLYGLFMGQILEARGCQKCDKVTMNIEYFTLLTLPIPRPESLPNNRSVMTLANCLNRFSEQEELLQDNMITCSCSSSTLVPATRLALLSKLPSCLVIQLARFSYNHSLRAAMKNDAYVSVPLDIDLYPYTMNAKLDSSRRETKRYELHAVCVHSGAQSTSYGHYVAYCKAVNREWYHYNDNRVTPIPEIEAELGSEFVLQNAYLLFYHSAT